MVNGKYFCLNTVAFPPKYSKKIPYYYTNKGKCRNFRM